MAFLDWIVFNNTLRRWALGFGVAVIIYLLLAVMRRVVLRQFAAIASRTRFGFDDTIATVLLHTRYTFLLFVSLYAGLRVLSLPPSVTWSSRVIGVIVVAVQLALWGNQLISAVIIRRLQARAEEDAAIATTVSLVGFVGRVLLWSVLALLALDNLGVDITALVAGLGIGGVAVALALQNVLGDLFASLSIVLDRPFVPGDFVVVGDLAGTVEKVGIKTTRVRALSGEQLIFSNADLLGSRIQNFKRMQERRVLFTLGLVYQTSREQLAAVPGMVREIIEAQDTTRFDRCHFKSYGAYSLDVEAVYYVLDPDYNRYMDTQQAINLKIFERFAAHGIEFAYPTQSLLLQRASP